MSEIRSWKAGAVVAEETRLASQRYREGTKAQQRELPYRVARTPSPPFHHQHRLKADIQLNSRLGIIHREDHRQRQSPPERQRGHYITKRTSPPAYKSFSTMTAGGTRTATSTTNTTRTIEESSDLIEEPSDRTREKNDIIADEEEDVDDNMSLISMTNLIANDVCRLQNCRFENIGPDIRQHADTANTINKTTMVRDGTIKNNNSTQRDKYSKPAAPSKSNVYTVWDNHPPPPNNADFGTPDTGSLTSGQSRSSEDHRASQIEFQVIDVSDNISEITPTGCTMLDGTPTSTTSTTTTSKGRNKSREKTTHPRTSSRAQIGDNTNKKESTPEENFHELLVSMSACLSYLGDAKDIRRTVSDAQTKFDAIDKKQFLLRAGITGQCCEPNQNSGDQNNKVELGNKSGGIPYSNFHHTPSSVASAPAMPHFKNNLDRYNKLVIGLMENDDDHSTLLSSSAAIDGRECRKYSPTWFKTKREVNKRRNNTQIIQEPLPGDEKHVSGSGVLGGTNVEVVWKQSKSFKEHKKILNATGSKEAIPTPLTKNQSRAPIFKKLLHRGKGKDRQEPEAPLVASVSITAKDPTKWQPEKPKPPAKSTTNQPTMGVTSCVSSTVQTTGDLSIDLCNSDVTMAIVGVPPVAAINAARNQNRSSTRAASSEAVANSKLATKTKVSALDPVVTRTSITPSRKSSGPVWRGDENPDFHPQWPKVNHAEKVSESIRGGRENLPRKNRSRCYHRNSEPIDLADTDSGPTMSWPQSRSFEDDCGQEDVKVVSIIGHHVSSTELEHCVSGFRKHRSMPSQFHSKQIIAKKTERPFHDGGRPRNKSGDKKFVAESPSSFSPTSFMSSSSGSSSYSSLSSLSQQRPSRGSRKANETDKHGSRNEFGMAFADFGAAFEQPERKDSKSRPPIQKINRIPMTPPKIQRSTDPLGVFESNVRNMSPVEQINVPVNRRKVDKIARQNVAL